MRKYLDRTMVTQEGWIGWRVQTELFSRMIMKVTAILGTKAGMKHERV